MQKRSLVWFRSDLRMEDNIALAEAMQASDSVLAVFILTPRTWQLHDAASIKIRFLLANLQKLSAQLWELGIPLLVPRVATFSDCANELKNICQSHGVDTIYFNNEYPIDERKRDDAVRKILAGDVAIKSFHEQLVLSPGMVLSKQGKPMQVFTPFKKEWISQADERQAWRVSKLPRKNFESQIQPDVIPNQLDGFAGQEIELHWPAGEGAAQKKLRDFCDKKLAHYKERRDLPGIDGTSMLSPYLAQGVLSARQCISAALQACKETQLHAVAKHEGAATWISELIWREFYHHIVYFHPDICRHKPFRPNTDNIPWRYDQDLLEAWKVGKTGFPIVDAAMRQLAKTGWMHNRLRMVTAMFLSKILLLDWRLGEKYFMEHLIDGDFAANNGGWQWSASTGTDAVPYFRIFNPTLQSQRFDPAGDFIRRYCPELSHLDRKTIHEPYANGIKLGELDYPQPIVDYKAMRVKTIAVFKERNG